jgi:sugar lactone lactonase YvrE
MKLLRIIRVGNLLGEGILWNADTASLWWTDIQDRRLYQYEWANESLRQHLLPERLGSFGFIAGSDELIAAFETGFARYNLRRDEPVWLSRMETLGSGIRFNDGRVDPQGRFWAGTMAESVAGEHKACLYCMDGKARVHLRERGLTICNGLCWSPDSGRMYLADSPRHTIWKYAFDAATGSISDRSVFARTPDEAFPDGAVVDAEGCLWSAQWGASQVVRYAPDGSVDRILELPVSRPTCVAFGGPELDMIFVTTAREGLPDDRLSRQTSAGDVFVYSVGVKGLPAAQFRPAEHAISEAGGCH